MRKLFLKFILFVLPVGVLLVAINVWVDPGNLFQKGLEDEMADIILNGDRLGVPREYINYNERLFQKSCITRIDERKDVIVFGSSRVRYIHKDLFPNMTFHNNAVNAASLEDFILLYGYYRERGLIPKKLILAPDHWILDKNAGYTNWHRLWEDYEKYADQMGLVVGSLPNDDVVQFWRTPFFMRWREALSPAYFQQSWKKILNGQFIRGNIRVQATEHTKTHEVYVINADGSFADQKFPASIEDVRNLVETVDDGISPLKKIDKRLAGNFEKFLDVLKADGVEVTILLVPFHPITYKKWIKDDTKGLLKADDYFREVAKKKGLKVIGSQNPDNIPSLEIEYRDWVHPRREVLERIILKS